MRVGENVRLDPAQGKQERQVFHYHLPRGFLIYPRGKELLTSLVVWLNLRYISVLPFSISACPDV